LSNTLRRSQGSINYHFLSWNPIESHVNRTGVSWNDLEKMIFNKKKIGKIWLRTHASMGLLREEEEDDDEKQRTMTFKKYLI
jgi:hypothetical protein